MYITKASGPPGPDDSTLNLQPKRGPLAPFGVPGGQS